MKIRCNEIYTENGCIEGLLIIEDGKIKDIICGNIPLDEDTLDAREHRILPGIIDIHTHGYMGCNAQATEISELVDLSKKMAMAGVTSFLPTAGEHFEGEMINLSLLADLIENPVEGAKMLGIHMEGPFLNPNKKGAFTLQQLLPCNIDKMKEYIRASRNNIKYVSLAPEIDEGGKLIQYLTKEGIIVAGGHTNATYNEYRKGIHYGVKASTHTGNGMAQIDRREVGALGAALLSDEIYNEIICDLHHISSEMLEIMFRIKKEGMHKMIMISDSGQLSGNPPGVYEKYGQKRIIDENGMICLEDGTIAGSSHNLLYGMMNLEKYLHKNMEDIIMMSSKNPAKLLGIDDTKGSIDVGKDADLLIINKNYEVEYTFVEGNCVYSK